MCWFVIAAHTCSWKKVVPVLVEGHSHDTVSQVKGFLYAITMVNVYVDVKNPRVVSVTHTGLKSDTSTVNTRWRLLRCVLLLEQLQYTDDDVIDITKPRCLQKPTKLNLVLQPFTNELNAFSRNAWHQCTGLCTDLKLFGMMQTSGPVDGNVTDLQNEEESPSIQGHNQHDYMVLTRLPAVLQQCCCSFRLTMTRQHWGRDVLLQKRRLRSNGHLPPE